MDLYLVRHGKAESGPEDAARRLTNEGREAVERVARALARAGARVDRIEHSGLVRAAETAEILADALGGNLTAVPDLAPEADVATVARRLETEGPERLMLVGHLPFMERLASELLTGNPDADLLHFRTASVALFSRQENSWLLEWFLAPKLV